MTNPQRVVIAENEMEKWDAVSAAKADQSLDMSPGDNFAAYCERDSLSVGVREFLGDLRGVRILEYGCGSGFLTVLLAASGAKVTSFDISPGSVDLARKRCEANGFSDVQLEVANAEDLPFEDESFDIIFGRAILHHLDVQKAAPHIERMLVPGGRACFVEPLGTNPVLSYVRDHVPYPNKNPVGDDHPFDDAELRAWGAWAADYQWQEVQLLSMLERAFPYRWKVQLPKLARIDQAIFRRWPAARRWARYVVVKMIKDG
jgi:SAM-dependent methyltransferase